MATLNPYLSFNGNAREAMAFYASVFGGTVEAMTYGDMGTEGEHADRVMHSSLETPGGFTLMGADNPPDAPSGPTSNGAVSLSGPEAADGAELRGYWAKLSERAEVTVPFAKQMWGDEFGMCTDRFGVMWMVNVGQPT